MDQVDWKIVNILYEEQNITRTAERMFISQPALTYRLKSIEEKLGIQIVNRTKTGIKFTRKGIYVAEQAEIMMYQFQKMLDKLQNSNDDNEGKIRIGVSTNFARFMLSGILKDFLQLYPKVQFNVTTSWSESIIEMIQREKINFAIIRGDVLWEYQKVLLRSEPICIISNEPIQVKDLPDQPRIIFNTDPSLQQTIDKWWLQNFNKPPKVTMQIDNIETCTKMVEKGLGYAIIPSVGLTDKEHLERQNLKDKNGNDILRDTWLLYKEEDTEYPIIKKFLTFLTDMFIK